MAWRRASLASACVFRSRASMGRVRAEAAPAEASASCSLHSGQRLANPGLLGLSSNSYSQMAQILIGNGMTALFYDELKVRLKCMASPVRGPRFSLVTGQYCPRRGAPDSPARPPVHSA
jgi:hypothetical protein